jgi:hypothetical protein
VSSCLRLAAGRCRFPKHCGEQTGRRPIRHHPGSGRACRSGRTARREGRRPATRGFRLGHPPAMGRPGCRRESSPPRRRNSILRIVRKLRGGRIAELRESGLDLSPEQLGQRRALFRRQDGPECGQDIGVLRGFDGAVLNCTGFCTSDKKGLDASRCHSFSLRIQVQLLSGASFGTTRIAPIGREATGSHECSLPSLLSFGGYSRLYELQKLISRSRGLRRR